MIRIKRRSYSAPPSPDERLYEQGTRGVADLVAPDSVEVGRDYIRVESGYARGLVVTNYPRTVGPNWLAPLLTLQVPLEISFHVGPLDSAQMVRKLSRKLVQLRSSQLYDEGGGKLASAERDTAYGDVESIRNDLQRGDTQVFSVGFYVAVRASSLKQLDSFTRAVENRFEEMGLQSRVAVLEQDSGFRSCLPEGTDRLRVPRNLDTPSLATAFPFSAPGLSMPTGMLYGIASEAQSLVIIDPFDESLANANMVVCAQSGKGKSYFVKLMALRNLLSGIDFVVIDPDNEYRAVCEEVGGQYVRLSPSSGQHINPFDVPLLADEEGRDPLADHLTSLNGWLEILLTSNTRGTTLAEDERSVLDLALRATYREAGITAEAFGRDVPPGSGPNSALLPGPLLSDLVRVLAETGGREGSALANRLGRYTEGSLAGLFNRPTNVAMNSRFVVFNLFDMPGQLKPLGIHTISSFVWNQVRASRKPRMLIIDEAWQLMKYEEGGHFVEELARRARKHFLGLVTITQDVEDFLSSSYGRAVIGNAAIKLLLGHDKTTVNLVVDALHLSDRERAYLLRAGKGEGLFLVRGTHVPIEIKASPREHEVCTTAPRELAARAAQPQRGAAEVAGRTLSPDEQPQNLRILQGALTSPRPRRSLFEGTPPEGGEQ